MSSNNFLVGLQAVGSAIPAMRAVVADATKPQACALPGAANAKVVGVTDIHSNASAAGEVCSVVVLGRARAVVGATVTQGDRIAVNDTDGKVKPVGAGDNDFAWALTGGDAGDVIDILIGP